MSLHSGNICPVKPITLTFGQLFFQLWNRKSNTPNHQRPPCEHEFLNTINSQLLLLFGAKLCLTLLDTMDCSPPGSSLDEISQARILEWVAISFSKGSSWPRDQTQVSCLAGGFFTSEPPGKPIFT